MPEDSEPTVPTGSRSDGAPDKGSVWTLETLVERWLGPAAAAVDETALRYRLGDVLGKGGMGEVRVAHDRRLRRDVAIKTARADEQEGEVGRFLHEAQVTAQLAHPNIPPIHDLGVGPSGTLFFTMRALPGRTLGQVLRDQELQSLPQALDVFGKICDAVAYAHDHGVLHRDLKPGNIILGDFGQVYVIDWGLAKRLTDWSSIVSEPDASGEEFTRAGSVVGTPGYMSPEQAAGVPLLDERCDVYSLGAVLYALVTGRSPFAGNLDDVMLRVMRGQYPPTRSVRRDLPWGARWPCAPRTGTAP